MIRPPPIPTLFPYTTLFRSSCMMKMELYRQGIAYGSGEWKKTHFTPKGISSRDSVRQQRDSLLGPESVYYRNLLASCEDRKSTRLNSSHLGISYAVFCLKKK